MVRNGVGTGNTFFPVFNLARTLGLDIRHARSLKRNLTSRVRADNPGVIFSAIDIHQIADNFPSPVEAENVGTGGIALLMATEKNEHAGCHRTEAKPVAPKNRLIHGNLLLLRRSGTRTEAARGLRGRRSNYTSF